VQGSPQDADAWAVCPQAMFQGGFWCLPYCKYGFPFKVPQLSEELDEDGVHFIYMRREHEDRMVVPYNPEIAILWGPHTMCKV